MNKLTWLLIIVVIIVVAWLWIGQGPASSQSFDATIENVSDSQPLSPGVFVVHNDNFSLNYEGEIAPSPLEPLAEYGSNADFVDFVESQSGVKSVIPIDEPILPGESRSFSFEARSGMNISGVQMMVATNDGISVIDSIELFDDSNNPRTVSVDGANYDNGTEENTPVGSGFEGGQPDPSQGEANVDNGTPTEPVESVSAHPQVSDAVLSFTISPAN